MQDNVSGEGYGAPFGTGFRAFGIKPRRVLTYGFNPSRGGL
jgi:hypothetical protein